MRSVIYVRTGVDWSRMTLEKFHNQSMAGKPGVLAWFMKSDVVERWNHTFTIPYWDFRHRLQLLAERVNAKVKGVQIIRGHDALMREFKNPKDCMLMPIDDDDWFSSTIAGLVSAADAPVQTWPVVNCILHHCHRQHGPA